VRININVRNAQTALFDTKAKLAKARYDMLLGGLKLRQANESLKYEDLQHLNAALAKYGSAGAPIGNGAATHGFSPALRPVV
jgi:hypothetical protein